MKHHVRLGVTGLRRSGKTVFLTALIYQLTQRGSDGLHAFKNRGIKLWPAKTIDLDRGLAPFPYDALLASLRQKEPEWPPPNNQESVFTLEIVYDGPPYSNLAQKWWRRCWGKAGDHGVIHLELHDYPGEYLLDIPLLGTDYRSWSKDTLIRMGRQCPAARKGYHDAVADLELQLKNHNDLVRALGELDEWVLTRIDRRVQELVQRRAAAVAVGTALLGGMLDAALVGWQTLAMIDEIARTYGGRPGLLGTLRLLRRSMGMMVLAELAEQATELLAEAVANKAAAGLGGRAAQGLGNGFLMLRLGYATALQCRPTGKPAWRPSVMSLLGRMKDVLRKRVPPVSASSSPFQADC